MSHVFFIIIIKYIKKEAELLPITNSVEELKNGIDVVSSLAHENEKDIKLLRKLINELKEQINKKKDDGGIPEELVD